jgi:hypothetical protein
MSDLGGPVHIKPEDPEKKDIDFEAVLAFLRQRGLRQTENLLQRELTSSDQSRTGVDPNAVQVKSEVSQASGETGSEVTNVLTSYKSDGDPTIYGDAYQVNRKILFLLKSLVLSLTFYHIIM